MYRYGATCKKTRAVIGISANNPTIRRRKVGRTCVTLIIAQNWHKVNAPPRVLKKIVCSLKCVTSHVIINPYGVPSR